MKQRIKQIIILAVVLFLGLGMLSPLFAMTDAEYNKFKAKEDHYTKVCKNYGPEMASECAAFADYRNEKIARTKEEIKNANSSLEDIKKNLDEEERKLQKYHVEIKKLESDIVENEKNIADIESTIKTVEKEIKEREDHIEELNQLVKQFLVNMQGEMRVNGYIEFVMGASDFSDIIRRSEGMKRIKEYNEALINEVLEEQKLLEADKEKLVVKKKQLESEKELLVVQVDKAKALKETIEVVVKELMVQKAHKEQLRKESISISNAEAQKLKDIFERPAPPPSSGNGGGSNTGAGNTGGGHSSNGWRYPIGGSFSFGPGVWNYPGWLGGTKHLGQDFSASIGTPIVAPANGVVIKTQGGCPTWGGFPNSCNGGWGNYMNLIVNVGGSYYGILYAHIEAGGFVAGQGQAVSAGQQVARVGSSGSSTGPHLHAEVYYLGNSGIDQAISYATTNTFGTGSSSYGNESAYRCGSNGNSAPCRMHPRSVWP